MFFLPEPQNKNIKQKINGTRVVIHHFHWSAPLQSGGHIIQDFQWNEFNNRLCGVVPIYMYVCGFPKINHLVDVQDDLSLRS